MSLEGVKLWHLLTLAAIAFAVGWYLSGDWRIGTAIASLFGWRAAEKARQGRERPPSAADEAETVTDDATEQEQEPSAAELAEDANELTSELD